MKRRVVVGLSGGVDSSVVAALACDQGYEVTGAYITCWDGPGCRSEVDRQDALDVALELKIPFVHLDFQKEYEAKVYEYMIAEYELGRTPNPDVMCNREIKFGLFYDWALRPAQGKSARFDFLATGHYAQIGFSKQNSDFCSPRLPQAGSGCGLENHNYCLLRSVDEHKDQTYFLYQLRQEQLGHILFPIGHMTKQQVRQEAKRRGLLTADKPDSQGICFIGEVSVDKFLESRIEKKSGKMKLDGIDVGSHKGVWFYTIGQKVAVTNTKNLTAMGFDTSKLPHFYVLAKDMENNILEVATIDGLFKNELWLEAIHWIGEKPNTDNLQVRIRHGGELVKIKEYRIENKEYRIILEQPVWGVAPGQSVVIYTDEVVLGGGVIRG